MPHAAAAALPALHRIRINHCPAPPAPLRAANAGGFPALDAPLWNRDGWPGLPGVQLHPVLHSRVLDVRLLLALINSFSFLAGFFWGVVLCGNQQWWLLPAERWG